MAFDLSNLTRVRGTKTEIFYGGKEASLVQATGWQCWTKPKNATMVFLLCIGGGGGGGGGFTGAAGTNRGGGGGGASGALARLIIPAFFLPRTLFLLAGAGGKGGAAGLTGIAGSRSAITDAVNKLGTAADTILDSGGGNGAPGDPGNGVIGGSAGGLAAAAAVSTGSIYQAFGVWAATGGQAGSAGGALAAPGTAITFGATGILLCGGTGAGSVSTTNVDQAGGAITGAGLIATQPGGVAAAGAGSSGLALNSPFINTGGTGGGTAGAAGTAGKGGDGAPGSGGGGGGGGVTGGAGGDGGPGLIVIMSW